MVMLTMSSDNEKQTKNEKKTKNKNACKKSKVVDLTISLYNLNKI